MKHSPKLLLALALASSVSARAHAQEVAGGEFQSDITTSRSPAFSSVPVVSEPSALGVHPKVTHYATQLDGDHSLKAATVVEQAFARYTLYTVRLQFASGALPPKPFSDPWVPGSADYQQGLEGPVACQLP